MTAAARCASCGRFVGEIHGYERCPNCEALDRPLLAGLGLTRSEVLRIGSLFSGYGGLDLGVQQVFGGEVQWHVEFDAAPSKILAHHWPDVPNYGDVRTVDWASVPPVDILTGGFPCQDVSLAGRRAGLTNGTRSGLWSEYARAIDILRPEMVVIENVRGLLSAEAAGAVEPDPWGMGDGSTRPTLNAFGVVLGDLAGLGYDARWVGVRAADAGAPHGRFRVFVLAHPAGARRPAGEDRRAGRVYESARTRSLEPQRSGRERVDPSADSESFARSFGQPDAGRCASEDADVAARCERGQSASVEAEGGRSRADACRRGGAPAADTADDDGRWGAGVGGESGGQARSWRSEPEGSQAAGRFAPHAETFRPSPPADANLGSWPWGEREERRDERAGVTPSRTSKSRVSWGSYAPAIERWERVLGRVAPAPTNADGRGGAERLAPEFVEWMMGLPEGHVTDPAIGLTRNEQLKALGNGVVPQQAALALRLLQKPVAGLQVAA